MFESLDVGIALLAGFLSGVAVPIGHPYVVAGAFDSVTGHGLTDGASLAANVLSELSLFFFFEWGALWKFLIGVPQPHDRF